VEKLRIEVEKRDENTVRSSACPPLIWSIESRPDSLFIDREFAAVSLVQTFHDFRDLPVV
jgi:hypothetical protein